MTFWLRGPTIEELRARGLGATSDYRPRPPLDLGPAPTPSADIGEERKCIVCSGAFTVTKTRKKTCSNACSVEQRRMRKRETRSMRRPFIAISYLSARRWGCAGTIASTRWNPTACRTSR